MIAAVFVDETVSSLVQATDRLEGPSRAEPCVEFNTQLANRNLFRQDLINDVVFESFDVHLQKVDRGISVPVHDCSQVPALELDRSQTFPRNGEGSLVGIEGHGEFKDPVFRRDPDCLELQLTHIASGDRG